jgi:hypothetical protein
MQPTRVKLELTGDEALVLYDWLTRFNQQAEADFQIRPRSVSCLTWRRCWRRRSWHRCNPIMRHSWHRHD